jgi:type 1 fimbria pilin
MKLLTGSVKGKVAGCLIRVLLIYCALSTAVCLAAPSISYSPVTLNFSPAGPYSPPRNEVVGTPLAGGIPVGITVSNVPNLLGVYNCNIRQTVTVIGTEVSTGVYPTGIIGVGVSFYFNSTLITSGNNGSHIDTHFSSASGSLPGVEARLVVDGQVATSSVSTSSSNLQIRYQTGLLSPLLSCLGLSLAWDNTDTLNTAGITTTPITCSVTTPSISVTLPNISTTSLSSVGQTTGDTPFNIELNCNSGANVYVTMTDATTPSNTTSLLSLGPSSTATGVKLRILKSDSNPVAFGPDSAAAGNTNQWLVGSSASVNNIPLTVQYYRDGALTAGAVNAVATFTMSYQ